MNCNHDFLHALWATGALFIGLIAYALGYLACGKKAKETALKRGVFNTTGTMATYAGKELN